MSTFLILEKCFYNGLLIYTRVIQYMRWIFPKALAIGSIISSCSFFSRNLIVMGLFTSQNTVRMTFTDCCIVVVMPRTILPRRNRRCALYATGTRKPEEEKDARDVTYFMEENVICPREVVRFDEHIRN